MLNKVAGLARALAIILAIVAAFAAIPAPVPLILVLLGLIGGLAYGPDDFIRLGVFALVVPLAAMALGHLPTIGGYLSEALGNVGLAVSAVLATRIILRLYDVVVGDITGLGRKDGSYENARPSNA